MSVDAESQERWTMRPRVQLSVIGLLSLALIALVAMNVVLAWSDRDDSAAVRSVASLQARNFFALDYSRPDESIDRVLALATGKFREEFESQREVILESLSTRKLQVEVNIPDGGVALVSLDGDSAEVLVTVDVETSSTSGKEQQQYRTKLLLSRVSDDWLVNDLIRIG